MSYACKEVVQLRVCVDADTDGHHTVGAVDSGRCMVGYRCHYNRCSKSVPFVSVVCELQSVLQAMRLFVANKFCPCSYRETHFDSEGVSASTSGVQWISQRCRFATARGAEQRKLKRASRIHTGGPAKETAQNVDSRQPGDWLAFHREILQPSFGHSRVGGSRR